MIEQTPFLDVIVNGTPVPQGSKNGYNRGGHVQIVDSNKVALAAWRKAIVTAIGTPAQRCPAGPVRAVATFAVRPPKRIPADRLGWPCVRIDVDKAQRAAGDALTTSGVIHDDAQIVQWVAQKIYVGHPDCRLTEPGVWIRLYRLTS